MKIRIFALIIILPLIYISCSKDDSHNENFDYEIDEPYDFPLKPGILAWNDLKTEVERFEAVQIPETVLKRLTDEALLQTCIDFPLFFYPTASSNADPSIGFGKLVDKFNGLQELYGRKYIERVLLCRYITQDMYSFIERYDVIRLHYFYMFLSRESVISELNEDQVNSFIKQSLDKYDTILNESPPPLICCNTVEPTIAYLMAKVMLYYEFPPFVEYYDSLEIKNVSAAFPDSTVKYAKQFINH